MQTLLFPSLADNRILAGISDGVRDALRRDFTFVEFLPGVVLEEQDEQSRTVYFPLAGVVSLDIVMLDGTQIEGAIVGREGVIGAVSSRNDWRAPWRSTVRTPTRAAAIAMAAFAERMAGHAELRNAISRYESALLVSIVQSIACNRLHTVKQRLARHLLAFSDRAGRVELAMTQESIASLLGVGRPTLSTAAAALRRSGAIEYSRGRIVVRDRFALRGQACECYARIQRRFDELVAGRGR